MAAPPPTARTQEPLLPSGERLDCACRSTVTIYRLPQSPDLGLHLDAPDIGVTLPRHPAACIFQDLIASHGANHIRSSLLHDHHRATLTVATFPRQSAQQPLCEPLSTQRAPSEPPPLAMPLQTVPPAVARDNTSPAARGSPPPCVSQDKGTGSPRWGPCLRHAGSSHANLGPVQALPGAFSWSGGARVPAFWSHTHPLCVEIS